MYNNLLDKILPFFIVLLTVQLVKETNCACENPYTQVHLYRYYNSRNSDHFYTTNWKELERGRGNYRYEGLAGQVFASQIPGTSPLHRYYNSRSGDHFYTLSWNELGGGKGGYSYEGIQCYIYPLLTSGTIPFYRYFSSSSGDHFYSTNWSELGAGSKGYRSEGISGYICPVPSFNPHKG